MHGRHCGEGIDVVAFHPYALAIIMANGIKETVLRRHEAGWHAWIANEDDESNEVRQSHGPSNDCEGVVGRGNIIIPGDKANSSRNMDQRVRSIQHSQESLMAMHEPSLHRDLLHRPQKGHPR